MQVKKSLLWRIHCLLWWPYRKIVMVNPFSLQVILILTKLYDFHIGSVTESTLWRWVKEEIYIHEILGTHGTHSVQGEN